MYVDASSHMVDSHMPHVLMSKVKVVLNILFNDDSNTFDNDFCS